MPYFMPSSSPRFDLPPSPTREDHPEYPASNYRTSLSDGSWHSPNTRVSANMIRLIMFIQYIKHSTIRIAKAVGLQYNTV